MSLNWQLGSSAVYLGLPEEDTLSVLTRSRGDRLSPTSRTALDLFVAVSSSGVNQPVTTSPDGRSWVLLIATANTNWAAFAGQRSWQPGDGGP